jgi:hypothetical protein
MKGIISRRPVPNLDESHFVLQNINQVIERQAGIVVEVIDHFKPIINVERIGRKNKIKSIRIRG